MSWLKELSPGFKGWHTWHAAGSKIEVFCCRGYSAGPLALITAGVHGDEYEGPAAIASLSDVLSPDRLHGTVIAVPVVNPAAFAAGTRLHPEDGLNLARSFPGNAHGSATQRLAAAFFEGLAVHADYLIDLHSGGVEYVFLPVTGFHGTPSADSLSLQAARAFGLPTLWRLPPTGGVLSYEMWRRGKVAIGAEYGGAGQLSECGVRDYRNGMISCLSSWGMLAPTSHQSGACAVYEGDWQLASISGIFQARCRLGDVVKKEATLAAIVGIRGEVLQEFTSPCDGVVLGLRSKAWIARENWAILIGKQVEIDV